MGKCFSSCSSTTSTSDQNGKSAGNPSKDSKAALTTPGTVSTPSRKGTSFTKSDISQRATLESKAKLSPPTTASPDIGKMPRPSFSVSKAQKLFERYKDPSADAILAEGMERFCQDLRVNPEEFIVLVLAWKFEAPTMCRFSRAGFLNGCRAMRIDSVQGVQGRFSALLLEVSDQTTFKDLYRFTFGFGLDQESGQRTLPIEIAMPLWRLVFSQTNPPILERWCGFLTASDVRGISRDTWQMFLNFVDTIGDDLDVYDDNEAWPSLFDDFVEYEKDKLTKGDQGRGPSGGRGQDEEQAVLV